MSLSLYLCTLALSTQASLVALTPEQHTYLTTKKQLTYCVDPNWMPFEAVKNGVHIGMSKDYVELLSKSLEIPFVLVPTSRWRQTLDYLEQGRCDLIPMLNRTAERETYASFSDVYFRDPNVLVVRTNHLNEIKGYSDLHGKSLAVIDGYMQEEYLRNEHPEIALVRVASELAGLMRVSSGDVDAVAGSLLAVTRHIQNAGLSNLHIATDLPQGDELRLAVHKNNPELLAILNLAIDNFSHQDHSRIYSSWNPISIATKTDYSLAWKIALASILILLLLLERYRASKKVNSILLEKNMELKAVHAQLSTQHQHLLFLATHDNLTGLLNRKSILEHIEKELTRWRRQQFPLTLLILDLDKFKSINDKYGHNAGDITLKTFANTLTKVVRETDFCARWGGEEFIIVSSNTDLKAASTLAERIHNKLAVATTPDAPTASCSIGIAQYHQQDSFEQWFERADKALYRAKMRGGKCTATESENSNG
ncbi:diguanylate cyclase [Simiduia curdlanivorans]|nr:diguanylate cyclase [Simiduia curdlanivorans]MDN3639417.1 diguanylate cyclase [Simiduia curdlanivorans]